DIEFDLITARLDKSLPATEKIGAVTVYRLGWGIPLLDKLLLPFAGAARAWRLHGERPYDFFWGIMVSFSTGAPYIVNILRRAIRRKKVPLVLTLQEGDSEAYLKWKWGGLVDLSWRLALRRTDRLTAISTYLLERARRLGFKGRAALVPNGVDIRRFEPGHRELDRSNVLLITTSRLVVKNGVGDLIEAMALLPESVSLKIVGSGPLEQPLKENSSRRRRSRSGSARRTSSSGRRSRRDREFHL
ncbi:glycosyltransferase, partial [Candidatus Parcubacteria bacterium]|nr:glycosyltransferase [Candidatus Parcubacteria bacterium]